VKKSNLHFILCLMLYCVVLHCHYFVDIVTTRKIILYHLSNTYFNKSLTLFNSKIFTILKCRITCQANNKFSNKLSKSCSGAVNES
jgi:hypothetical protein